MKKLIVIGIVATMVMGLSVAAMATGNYWTTYFHVGKDTTGLDGAPSSKFGIRSQTTDLMGFLGTDYSASTPELWFTDATHAFPAAPATDTRYYQAVYSKDNKLPTNANPVTWDLQIKATAGSTVYLTGWNPTGAANDWDKTTFNDLILFAWDGVDVASRVALITFDSTKNGADTGTAITGDFIQRSIVMPGTGVQHLQLFAGSIPEPGSMVALLSGLVGLVGFGIRRRK